MLNVRIESIWRLVCSTCVRFHYKNSYKRKDLIYKYPKQPNTQRKMDTTIQISNSNCINISN